MGLIQNMLVIKQAQGEVKTYCKTCGEVIRYSPVDARGSYRKNCACGCEINTFHAPDEFHDDPFYTKVFIPKKRFIKNYKKKDAFLMNGFKKEGKNYVK